MSIKINFVYTEDDLDKPLHLVFLKSENAKVTLEHFGITEKKYEHAEFVFERELDEAAQQLQINYREGHELGMRENLRENVENITPEKIDEIISSYWEDGTTQAGDYVLDEIVTKDEIARCVLYNGAKYSSLTLREWLLEFQDDVENQGDLLEIIRGIDIQDLFDQGW
jgi:hypothetical protein